MVLKLRTWIVFAVVNSSLATDVESWKHEHHGLQQMLQSEDGEHLFVASNSEVFILRSSDLRIIDTFTNTDGLLTVLFNNDLDHVTFCSNGTEQCRKYQASNITDGGKDAGYKIRTRNAQTLVTQDDTLFFACPHDDSYSASIEDEPCSDPGIFWMNQAESRFQSSIYRQIMFKKENSPTVTENYFAAFEYEKYRWFVSQQRGGTKLFTRIAQLCNCPGGCLMSRTYVDMEVVCGDEADMVMADVVKFTTNDTVYIVAVFQSSTSDKSAICMYPAWEIEQRFIQNFDACFHGYNIDYSESYIPQSEQSCKVVASSVSIV